MANCQACGHYDLEELGCLGRRVHFRCRACGLEQSLVGFSEARLEELSRQHGMDGGGYCFDNAEIEPFAGLGCVAWTDPRWDYLGGVEVPEGRGECHTFFWAVGRSNVEWPASYVEQRSDDGLWLHERVGQGYFAERAVSCNCHGTPDADAHDGWEFSGNCQDEPWPGCPWCEGDGSFDGEGGDYAIYVERELEPALEPLALELATQHAESPEVREAGGPEADDADTFDVTVLQASLQQASLPSTELAVEALREALREALEELEEENDA